jgi:hypothetical protein
MKKIITWTIILILIVSSVTVYWKYYFTYSDGFRAGLLQKFSRKGALFKTYEGEMILSSIQSNKNTPLASEKFYFSVDDGTLASKLENLQGNMVIVHYKQKNGTLIWRGESAYMVDSVRAVQ